MNDVRSWTWRHAVAKSDLAPTTRHVLLTISLHMNDVGEGCYPSTAQLRAETGLSERAVCEHIAKARDAGWLNVEKHGFAGQKWARNEYRPKWPDPDPPPTVDDDDGGGDPGAGNLAAQDAHGAENEVRGTDAGSVPSAQKALTQDQYLEKGTDAGSVEGTDPNDRKALTQGQSNTSSKTSTLSQGDEGAVQLSFSKRWNAEAQAAIRDMVANPVTAHIVEKFIAEVCGTLNPPAEVDPPSYVRQLRNRLRDATPQMLATLAGRMIETRGRDLPTISEIASALAAIKADAAAVERRAAMVEAGAAAGPGNRKPVTVERGMVPWDVWLEKLSPDERAGAEAVGKILVTDLWPSKPSARFVGLPDAEVRS